MSERMRQEKADALIDVLRDGTLTPKGVADLAAEFSRARREEVQQTAEIERLTALVAERQHSIELLGQSSETTIKALADVLREIAASGFHNTDRMHALDVLQKEGLL